MLFRYSFPVPQQSELSSITRYVESDRNPTRQDILNLLNAELEQMRKHKRGVKELEACIFAVQHIRHHDFPLLPTEGSSAIPVLCDTRLGVSAIRIALVNPIKLVQSQ